ncbi:hypothetical protein E3N88_26595 [Mikania micrantha]|uniref:Uncharacterized protein n=1 Tax=Mikania micrantha TaxID=192012 RepID=A0A5N6MVR9_9ASTR|nr:hypothetical protein E3N88_26595 [Mikania micrantha]
MPTPRVIWDQIELAESYLVCSMFEEASSLASRVLKCLHDKDFTSDAAEDIELNDMLESAGMVFLQSFKELGRYSFNELTQLYGSLAAIPVQVFLACFQMQEDPHGFLRRLHSMNTSNDTGSQASTSASVTDGNSTSSVSLIKEGWKQADGDDAAKQAYKISGQNVSTFWLFRKVNLKFGSIRFAVSNGSILLAALMLFAYYYLRRKKYTITR